MKKNLKKNLIVYGISLSIPLLTGFFSYILTKDNTDIYSEIKAPPLSPPSFLFPIVWTALYVLMGISSGIIYNKNDKSTTAENSLLIYSASLVFNFIWSIIFFNFRMFLFSFIWLAILFILIILTIRGYRKISKGAARLQIPYALWVAFAGYLNLGIYILNR